MNKVEVNQRYNTIVNGLVEIITNEIERYSEEIDVIDDVRSREITAEYFNLLNGKKEGLYFGLESLTTLKEIILNDYVDFMEACSKTGKEE
jgi:hypothetical protein